MMQITRAQGLAATIEETMRTIPLMQKVVSPFLYSVVSGVLISHGHNLFLKTTPRKLLQGHHINLFETASQIVEPLSVFGLKKEDLLPSEELPNNAFGILNGKNNTAMGPYEINTGIVDQSKYSYMVSFKGEKQMNKWSSEFCNRVFGTDGAQFPPFRSKTDRLPIFAADLCRTLYLLFEQEAEFKGIPVWRMKLDPKLFESPKMNPDNECYCPHMKRRPERCSIRGTIDLSGCLNGAPLVLSSPHFLGTEPNLADLVEGLKPDKKRHEFFLMFEPRLGVPLFAYGRLQLSIRVERTSFLRGFDQVRSAFIPFVWIEESGGVDDFLAGVLKFIIVFVIDGSVCAAWFLMVIGFLVAAVCYLYACLCVNRSIESEERLYSVSSRARSLSKLPPIESEDEEEEEEDDEEETEKSSRKSRSRSSSSTSNSKNSMEMRASAPALHKARDMPNLPPIPPSYTPIYRKSTTTRTSSSSFVTRSNTLSSIHNKVTASSPTRTTTISVSSGRSMPRIRDLEEIRQTVPLVKLSDL